MANTRQIRFSLLLVATIALVAAACGTADDADQIIAQQSATTLAGMDSTSSASLNPIDADASDPVRFGDFPFEATNDWLIGVDYVSTSFVVLDGEAKQNTGEQEPMDTAAEVVVHFLGRSQISIFAAGCSIGGGSFEWTDGRITNPVLADDGPEPVACAPTDSLIRTAAAHLIESEPEIRVDGARLLLLGDNYRLEMEAAGPGVGVLIHDNERFMATESTVVGLDPARIELASPAYFVLKVTVPVCELYGGIAEEAGETVLRMESFAGQGYCDYAPDSDKLAQAFFQLGAPAVRDGDILIVENEQGMIQFRLATTDDPPMAQETPDPPDRIIPPQPDRSEPAQAGKASTPWYVSRAGSTEPGGVDIPAPEGWDVANLSLPSIHAAGRGTLDVYDVPGDQVPWTSENHPDGLELVDGPIDVTIKLYQEDSGTIVESGATTTVTQYRYGSSSSNEWRRQVVWILERDGTTTIAVVGFPEFPEGSGFDDPADSINLSLTGLDPIDLLNDIRFFQSVTGESG